MTVPATIITNIKTSALEEFDTCSHIGFGDDNTTPTELDSALGNELIRKAFDEAAVKTVSSGTYDFFTTLGLTEANGNTVREVGLFDAASSGNLFTRKLTTVEIAKTATIELNVGMRIKFTITNV